MLAEFIRALKRLENFVDRYDKALYNFFILAIFLAMWGGVLLGVGLKLGLHIVGKMMVAIGLFLILLAAVIIVLYFLFWIPVVALLVLEDLLVNLTQEKKRG